MKRQALASLHEVVNQDEKFVVVVMEVVEVIHPLVSFLDSQEMEVREEAARVLSVVAGFDSCRGVVIAWSAAAYR
ncbi:hypothetical protein NL676_029165 [Syzygium grande]|nr:hypothetical protein NL676_029165 [Syzygium grande]